jgi:hypothetical protein
MVSWTLQAYTDPPDTCIIDFPSSLYPIAPYYYLRFQEYVQASARVLGFLARSIFTVKAAEI